MYRLGQCTSDGGMCIPIKVNAVDRVGVGDGVQVDQANLTSRGNVPQQVGQGGRLRRGSGKKGSQHAHLLYRNGRGKKDVGRRAIGTAIRAQDFAHETAQTQSDVMGGCAEPRLLIVGAEHQDDKSYGSVGVEYGLQCARAVLVDALNGVVPHRRPAGMSLGDDIPVRRQIARHNAGPAVRLGVTSTVCARGHGDRPVRVAVTKA